MALKEVPKNPPNILFLFGDDTGIPQVSAWALFPAPNPHRLYGDKLRR